MGARISHAIMVRHAGGFAEHVFHEMEQTAAKTALQNAAVELAERLVPRLLP